MPNIHEQYESQKNILIAALNKRIKDIYEKAIQQIQITISTVTYKGTKFNLADYPSLKKRIDAEINRMHASISVGMINGIEASWALSNKKNDSVVDQQLKGKKPNKVASKILFDPNIKALEAFKARADKGLDLSGRVWNLLAPYKKEIEQTIGVGLGTGQSAADIAGDLKKYLNEPDRLFRRVRGEDGKLHLSAAARNYKPGQGVYRSSYQNALRLSGTENNIAYRTSDHLRWQTMSFIVGIEVRLSNNHDHEIEDICDHLAGVYQKDFKFTGWHPRCRCFQIPVTATKDQSDKMIDAILAGEDPNKVPTNQVTLPPKGFTDYLAEHKDQIAGWKNVPYWMKDNPQFVNGTVPAPKPIQEELSGPVGENISSQFTKVSKSIKQPVGHAFDSIDKVHGDGQLDDIPIVKSRLKDRNAFFARLPDGKADQIGLTSLAQNPALSIVHEMGHYLDLYSIGDKGSFGSMQKDSPLSKVLEAADRSTNIQTIKKVLSDGSFVIDGQTIPMSWSTEAHLKYLLQPIEIWARAYSQFIAKRSNSEPMLTGLKKLMDKEKNDPITHQWNDDDFLEIEKEIDAAFKKLGWMI